MKLEEYLLLGLAILASTADVQSAFWVGTPLNNAVEKMRSDCEADNTVACLQYKAFWFLDTVLQGNYFQLPGQIKVTRNDYQFNNAIGRSENTLENGIEEFVKSYDFRFNLPYIGSVMVDSRNLDNEEYKIKLKLSDDSVEARKKSKLKKIFVPILVLILLKAMSLVPFALGVLGFKAWNSLQLAFFSFIISTGVAIFQICQKLANDGTHAHIASPPGIWDTASGNQFSAKGFYSR